MAGSDSSQHSLSSFCFRCNGSSAKYTSPVAGRTGLSWVVVDSSSLVSMSRCEGTTCCRQDRFIVGRRRFFIHGVTVVVEQPIRRRGTNIGGATIPKTMLLVDLVPTRQLCFGSRHLMVMHRSTCCARDDCSCCWCLAAVGGSGIVIFYFLSSSLMKEIDDSLVGVVWMDQGDSCCHCCPLLMVLRGGNRAWMVSASILWFCYWLHHSTTTIFVPRANRQNQQEATTSTRGAI